MHRIISSLCALVAPLHAEFITGLSIQSGSTNPFNVEPMGPAKAINGEGLPGSTPALTGTHGTSFDQHWWTWATGIPDGAQITIDLGANYKINVFQIWNYNEGGVTVRGIQNGEIYVSPDEDPANLVKLVTSGSGTHDNDSGNFLLPQAPGAPTYEGFALDLSGITNLELLDNVRLVQIVPLDSYDNSEGVGLAEIQFDGEAPVDNSQPLELAIAQGNGLLEFQWKSKEGKVYDLVSSVDLAIPVSEWAIYEGYSDIPDTSPENTISDVALGGQKRFFALIEKNSP